MRIRAAAWLVALALAACEAEPAEAPKAPPRPQFQVTSASEVVQGERLARILGCTGCHGADLTGHAWIEDPQDAILFTSNLTRAVSRYSDAQLERAIRLGVRYDGSALWEMPSDLFTHLDEADMRRLIRYLRTVAPAGVDHPRIVIGPRGRRLIAAGEIKPAAQVVRENRDRGPPVVSAGDQWARYMIRATCAECHGIDLHPRAGDTPPDLVVASAYSREQFHRLLRTGQPTGGRRLDLMATVARGRFAHMTNTEIDAIYDYLVARARRPQ
jgi:cytochrome c553